MAIRIIKWNPPHHLLDVWPGMEAIGIQELPPQRLGQEAADSSLPRSGDSHQDDDHCFGIPGHLNSSADLAPKPRSHSTSLRAAFHCPIAVASARGGVHTSSPPG
jgi:hypothetical protein